MKPSAVLRRSLLLGGIVTAAIAVFGSIIGFLVAGQNGLASALLGALLAAAFMGITAASVLLAERVTRKQPSISVYFGIILGLWFVKLVVFVVVLVLLRGQPFIDPYIFFITIVVAVIGSLVADALAVQRTRVTYVSDVE
jgi:hypothetical protein